MQVAKHKNTHSITQQPTSSQESIKSLMNSAIGKLCRINSYVKVDIEGTKHMIKIIHGQLTCGWLLGQVKNLFEKKVNIDKKEIVAISTENKNITLDYYLTLLDRYLLYYIIDHYLLA